MLRLLLVLALLGAVACPRPPDPSQAIVCLNGNTETNTRAAPSSGAASAKFQPLFSELQLLDGRNASFRCPAICPRADEVSDCKITIFGTPPLMASIILANPGPIPTTLYELRLDPNTSSAMLSLSSGERLPRGNTELIVFPDDQMTPQIELDFAVTEVEEPLSLVIRSDASQIDTNVETLIDIVFAGAADSGAVDANTAP